MEKICSVCYLPFLADEQYLIENGEICPSCKVQAVFASQGKEIQEIEDPKERGHKIEFFFDVIERYLMAINNPKEKIDKFYKIGNYLFQINALKMATRYFNDVISILIHLPNSDPSLIHQIQENLESIRSKIQHENDKTFDFQRE
jgi:hypothetical protein